MAGRARLDYLFSFFGVIDVVTVAPFWLQQLLRAAGVLQGEQLVVWPGRLQPRHSGPLREGLLTSPHLTSPGGGGGQLRNT